MDKLVSVAGGDGKDTAVRYGCYRLQCQDLPNCGIYEYPDRMNSTPNQLWRHPGKRRYYRVQVMPDLFGELCLIRVWSSLDKARGNHKTERLADWQEVSARLDKISKERRRKGYQPISSP